MRSPHLGFWIFLIIYGAVKYLAVPEMMFQLPYILTTLLLIFLTAVIPYIIGFWAVRKTDGVGRYAAALATALGLGALGLAIYFYLFIAPNAPGMAVTAVLPRAIIPGLILAAVLVLPFILHRGDEAGETS